jgi:hypothetical protein
VSYDVEQVMNNGVLESHAIHVVSGEAVIKHYQWMGDHFGEDAFMLIATAGVHPDQWRYLSNYDFSSWIC